MISFAGPFVSTAGRRDRGAPARGGRRGLFEALPPLERGMRQDQLLEERRMRQQWMCRLSSRMSLSWFWILNFLKLFWKGVFKIIWKNIFITMQLSPCSMRPRKTGSIRKRAKQATLMDGRTSMNNIRHCLLLCALAAFSNLFFGPRFFLVPGFF